MNEEFSFKECKICLINRDTIERANNTIRSLEKKIEKYTRTQHLNKFYCHICNCELSLGTSRKGKTLGHCPNCKSWQGINRFSR